MSLQVVGAGLPRTGTASLAEALSQLLGGRCYHMREIPGHPFDLGEGWNQALSSGEADWDRMLEGYHATVDWPAAMFWREISQANPDALVLLSLLRDSADTWWQSANATILPYARQSLDPSWSEGCGLVNLLERFTGTSRWDDPGTMKAAYERHNRTVRELAPKHRLLEWRAADGWEPICQALQLPVPETSFPWVNRRSEWG